MSELSVIFNGPPPASLVASLAFGDVAVLVGGWGLPPFVFATAGGIPWATGTGEAVTDEIDDADDELEAAPEECWEMPGPWGIIGCWAKCGDGECPTVA